MNTFGYIKINETMLVPLLNSMLHDTAIYCSMYSVKAP